MAIPHFKSDYSGVETHPSGTVVKEQKVLCGIAGSESSPQAVCDPSHPCTPPLLLHLLTVCSSLRSNNMECKSQEKCFT